jgi:methyl coenzyme M reductase gamma subunit
MLEINGEAIEYKPGPIDMSDLDRKFKEFEDAFKNLGKLFAEKLAAVMGVKKAKEYYKHEPKAITPE